jgi:hypothetical protein
MRCTECKGELLFGKALHEQKRAQFVKGGKRALPSRWMCQVCVEVECSALWDAEEYGPRTPLMHHQIGHG